MRVSAPSEPVLVQALVAKLSVETFHVRVLNRLTRANEAQLDAGCIRPAVERSAGKLWTVVHKEFGARVGALVVAFNPKTLRVNSAIIGDTGPMDNLGEGSVLLNMKLLGTTVPPTNKAEAFRLSIEDAQILVAIIPASRAFREVKPYTTQNIDARVRAWPQEAGFASSESSLSQ